MKIILAYISILYLTACGFRPIYIQEADGGRLSGIKVGEISMGVHQTKLGYNFRSELNLILDSLAPQQRPYLLDVVLSKTLTNYATQQNTTNIRSLLTLTATYSLKEAASGKTITADSHSIMDSFEISASPYSALVSEEETENKLARILAHEVLLKLEDTIINKDAKEASH